VPVIGRPNAAPQDARRSPRDRQPLGGQQQRHSPEPNRQPAPAQQSADRLPGKPYGFVALPNTLTSAPPVWHDGTCSQGRLSGEIRFELEMLTPLLVGWKRGVMGNNDAEHPVPLEIPGAGPISDKKSVLCPLRAPWGLRPVIIPGDSLKGLLRHELGALLGAPTERVRSVSYSYRPNIKFGRDTTLIVRLARIPADSDAIAVMTFDEEGH
jgi:hypothetical protein